MLIDWLASDEMFFSLLGLAALAFIWNGAQRIAWERQWRKQYPRIPESMVFYGATELKAFASLARKVIVKHEVGLSFYANKILRGCDLAYAAALATLTAYVWFRIAIAHMPAAPQSWASSAIVWFAPYCAAMAIAYGIADVTEDLKLASILLPRGAEAGEKYEIYEIDRAEAAAANMLTIIKMLTLALSIIGLILFFLLRWTQSITKSLTGTPAENVSAFVKSFFQRLRGQTAAGGTGLEA